MKTRFIRPLRVTAIAACVAFAFAVNVQAQEAPPQVIDQGDGWQLISIPAADAGVPGATTDEPAPILLVDSAAGLEASPLPDSIKQELAPEFGASEADVSIAVHYDVATAIADGTAEQEFAAYIEADAAGEGAAIAGIGCSTGWRHRTKTFNRTFSGYDYEKTYTSGGFTGEFKVDAPISGNATVDVEWAFKKTAFCLPWTAKFVNARARGTIDVQDTMIQATGTARYEAADRKELAAPSFEQKIHIGPIPLIIGAEFPVGVGYAVEANGTANVALKSRAQGQFTVDMTCTRDGCDPTPGGSNANNVTFEDLINPEFTASVQVQADVKPYAYVEARGYLYHQDIASAGVGAELSLPTRLFYYAGNTCGNASGAASGDTVNGGYVNVAGQLEFYRNATVFWDDSFAWLDSPIPSAPPHFRNVEVTQFLRGANEHTALRSQLYFTTMQFGGGQHPLTPILAGPANVDLGATASYTVRKRPCVPMDDTLNYTIAWGDGSGNANLQAEPAGSASATHAFNVFGTQTVTAKMVNDAAGRTISRTTSRVITVDADAEPPMPNGMTVPVSDADGTFTASWTASVNTSTYKLFRRVNTGAGFGAWSQIDTVTGTSKNLTAQPFGTVQYGVRACNSAGCSDTRTSSGVVVGVTPAAPALTVRSEQCHGMNAISWTQPSGANNYKLYSSAGTDPANAGKIYDGPASHFDINVSGLTRLWVKACGTGGCSGFSAMKSANVNPQGCE
jgi:hypothetical protein